MTTYLWLGLGVVVVLIVMYGIVSWHDDQGDEERRRRIEEDYWRRRERDFHRGKWRG